MTRQANEGFAKVVAARGSFQDPALDLADELAGLLGEWLAGDRVGVELEYELYLAALRNPALRADAAEWCQELPTPSPSASMPSRHGPWSRSWTGSRCRCCSRAGCTTPGTHGRCWRR